MREIAKAMARICEGFRRVSIAALVVIGAVMSVIVLLQIIFRFLIHVPFPWSEELARYLMIWMGMLGAFVALREGRHIGVSLFVDRLPPAWAARVMLLVQVATIVFLGIVAKQGFSLALFNASQLSPAMQIPMIFPYMAVPVGASLMILELVASVLGELFQVQQLKTRRLTAATLDG
ncbi:MAG: TRAP transporter small permease [bacterium]